jgi:hypothetical protein
MRLVLAGLVTGCSLPSSSPTDPPPSDGGDAGQDRGGGPSSESPDVSGVALDAPTNDATAANDASVVAPVDAVAPGLDVLAVDAPAGKIAHRILSSISDKGPLAIVARDGTIEWQFNVMALGPEANDARHPQSASGF